MAQFSRPNSKITPSAEGLGSETVSAPRRQTIRDVSLRAGVSMATVSQVMSGKRPVKPATAERVRAAIRELGYEPDRVARAMTRGYIRSLGIVLPDITNPFFPRVARGAEDVAAESGFSLMLASTDLRPERETSAVDNFLASRVGGILYMAGSPEAGPTITRLRASGRPFVLVDESFDGPAAPGVFSENEDGGYQAGRHLVEIGCSHIVHLTGQRLLPTVGERERGFRRGLAEAGIHSPVVIYGNYSTESGFAMTSRLLSDGIPFDAVFAGDDLLALGAVQALKSARRRVPQDVAVCGFDGIPGIDMWTPSLTTVVQRAYELGAEAARALIAQIENGTPIPRVVLPVEFVVRASTDAGRTTVMSS